MSYSQGMLIGPGSQTLRPKTKARPQQQAEVRPPVLESTVTSAVVGASLGTVTGEMVGSTAAVLGVGYAGFRLGSSFGPVGALAGAAVGGAGTYFLEKKVPIGRYTGAAVGFLTGGIIGGVTGAALGVAGKVFG